MNACPFDGELYSSCAIDANCYAAPNSYCDAHDICVPQKPKGASCDPSNPAHCASATANPSNPPTPCAECATGLTCVDGVCCDSTCTGDCQACDLPGSVGTCTTLTTGQPHHTIDAPSPRSSPCPGSGACVGYCDGTSATTCSASTTLCAFAVCDKSNNYTLDQGASCSQGSCPAQTQKSCAPFACVSAACRTSCDTNADCASTSPTCNVSTHTCS